MYRILILISILFSILCQYHSFKYNLFLKENERKKKLAELEAAQKLAAELKGKEVTINAKAGDNGRLFGAITNKDVAEAINSEFNLSIDKKKVVVNTIKVAGTYEVEVKLYPEVSTKMKVNIVPKQ